MMADRQIAHAGQNLTLVFVGALLSLFFGALAWLQIDTRQKIIERLKEAACADKTGGKVVNAEDIKVRCD